MVETKVITFSSVFLIFLGGVTSLRDVQLVVEPTVVIRGGTAALACNRDMEGAPLYSVKWYRGTHEFYRFTPNEKPMYHPFGIPGITVDIERSNGSQVILRHMDLSLAGNFSCEVTADAPTFATQIVTKFIDVLALPTKDPVLQPDKERYQPGEILKANCSSSPAKPVANITILINDEPLRSTVTWLHPSESGLQWTSVNAELKVTPELFQSGRLRLACRATVYHVYNKTAILDFFTPDTDPRPERITSSKSTKCLHNLFLLVILLFLPMVVIGQVLEKDPYIDFYDRISQYDYEDEIPEKLAMRSLVGG